MNIDEYYIGIAQSAAWKSTCLKKHYGAVIVNNSEICGTGYNGPPRGEPHCEVCSKIDSGKDMATYCTCPAVHAEMNAIISVARRDMFGGTLYLAGWDVAKEEEVNAEPCEICLRLIKNAGINEVYNRAGLLYKRDEKGILKKVTKND